jgi:hypothetical protein
MTKTEVLIPRGDTRSALAAALPHVGGDPDHVTSRVRLSFVAAGGDPGVHLLVSAADGYSAAVSRVYLHEVVQLPALAVVDLPVQSVKDVLAVFKPPPGKDARQVWLAESFRLVVDDEDTTWEEAGQLLDGRSLTVPRLAPLPDSETAYPDVPGVLVRTLASPLVEGQAFAVSATLLARVVASAKAHGEGRVDVAHHEPRRGRMFVWSAGPNLLGAVSPIRLDDDDRADERKDRDAWAAELAPLARPSDFDPAARAAGASALRKAMEDGGVFTFAENGIYEVNLDQLPDVDVDLYDDTDDGEADS